ncbi:MAG: SHOCT domain-containing protein [Salinisphaera sp.]|uniref:SHOCT domain-containing protein n=1 Tax=Salinisphaera sp. TaxID=1914330 RepID=UPI003C797AEF
MGGIRNMPSPLLIAATAVATPAWAQTGDGYYGPGMMWNGGWIGMFFAPLMMIIFFGAVIVLVVVAIRWLTGMGAHHSYLDTGPQKNKALEILKERFARGEIDKEEFQDKKKHLTD